MLKKLAFIKNKVKLHKRSSALCIWNMLLCATVIPVVICMAAWVFWDGEPPAEFRYGQFIVYFIIIGRCWYSCYLRKWSHSYMLDYTQKILDPQIRYCPRCFSPIKVSQQDFTYEKKIGETVTTVYYSDGSSSTVREPIMTKEKETLPHLVCKERSCHLGSKTQRDSAQSEEVRNQLKDNYSFCEMPRTLNKTHRLIAGDRQDSYRRSMADEMCFGGFWARIILLMGIFLVVSMFKDLSVVRNVYSYLFGTAGALALYTAMIVLLLITYIAFQAMVGTKTKSVMDSKEFRDEVAHFEDLEYDIYLTKWLADTKVKERKKTMKKSRKEGLTVDKAQNNYTRYSNGQWEKRKKAYRSSLIATVKETLEKNGYTTESYYYSQCYVLRAHAHSVSQPDCDFFISKDTCFMRGSSRFNYGAHQSYIEGEIADVLRNGGFNNVDFYVDKNLLCSRVSFGLLASSTLDVEELNASSAKEMISAYFEAMSTIQKRVSPDVLATVEPEYMVIREVNRNGFTWE